MNKKNIRNYILILFAIFFIGCPSNDPSRAVKEAVSEKSSGLILDQDLELNNLERKVSPQLPKYHIWEMDELNRRAKVQDLIERMDIGKLENRHSAYVKLRDVYVRKRDIPFIRKEIKRSKNPEIKSSLDELITYINRKSEWRLPNGGWTSDYVEYWVAYTEKFDELGCGAFFVYDYDYSSRLLMELSLFIHQIRWNGSSIECKSDTDELDIIDLILTAEPEALKIHGDFQYLEFLSVLSNLKALTLVSLSTPDIAFVQDLPNLNQLRLIQTTELNFDKLNQLKNLKRLWIESTGLTDVKYIAELTELEELILINESVANLSQLKTLSALRKLSLQDIPVADLTFLTNMPELTELHLRDTKIKDLRPLNEAANLEYIYLENSEERHLIFPKDSSVKIRYGRPKTLSRI